GVPHEVTFAAKNQLALDLLDRLAAWDLTVPVVVADCGYGRSVGFRLALEDRGLNYMVAVEAKEVAHAARARPHWPAYSGLGPPTLPRYRTRPLTLPELTAEHGVFSEIVWRLGSKGVMRSRFTVLQ
ncbi:transposase, partial [Streptomyces formicae]